MDTNLGTIKNKVHFTFFQDGLWDIFLGVFLLAWGLTVWFNLPFLPGGVFVLFFWLVLGLKQLITYPRIGYARPIEHQSRLIKTIIIIHTASFQQEGEDPMQAVLFKLRLF